MSDRGVFYISCAVFVIFEVLLIRLRFFVRLTIAELAT
jgi:hypothetical protein